MESKYAGMSPYNYSFNNPVMWNDLNGADPGIGDDDPKVPKGVRNGGVAGGYKGESETTSTALEGVTVLGHIDRGPGEYHYKMSLNTENGTANLELLSFRNKNHHSWFWGLLEWDSEIGSKRYIVDFDLSFWEEGLGTKRYYIGFPLEGKGYSNGWKAEDFERDYLEQPGYAVSFIFDYSDENTSRTVSHAMNVVNTQNRAWETAIPMAKPEYYYRSMSVAHYEEFKLTNKIPATTETFISPTQAFSESYEGVLVKFQVKAGTADALRNIGVRAHGAKSAELLPDLPEVKRKWGNKNALFKPEGSQINIGLGKGKALELFNKSIIGYETIKTIPAK